MDCVAYLRVSTEKQAEEGLGLDSQKRDVSNYCKEHEMIITDWFVDDGYTGTNMDRPEFQRMLNCIYSKQINNVVVFKLDRLSRSTVDNLYIIEKIFVPNGVKLHSVHDKVDYDTPSEQMITQMLAIFAQYDKNTMMLRMRGGMLERVKKGYWYGGGNTPYCYSYDRELGYLVPIPENAEKANMALDLFIDGYSDVKIKELLGFKTEQVVRNILTSRANIGEILYKGNYYKGLHEPVFDREKFELAQKLREQRKLKKSYNLDKVNILTGLCYCGVCGCKMRYQKWGSYHVIHCYSRHKYMKHIPNFDENCNNRTYVSAEIENYVIREIEKINLNIENYVEAKENNKIISLNKELEDIGRKLKRLYLKYADGNDIVLDLIKELEERKKTVSEEIEVLTIQEKSNEERKSNIEEIKKVADAIKLCNNDIRKTNNLLKIIIDKIVLSNDNIEIVLKNF